MWSHCCMHAYINTNVYIHMCTIDKNCNMNFKCVKAFWTYLTFIHKKSPVPKVREVGYSSSNILVMRKCFWMVDWSTYIGVIIACHIACPLKICSMSHDFEPSVKVSCALVQEWSWTPWQFDILWISVSVRIEALVLVWDGSAFLF